MLTCAVCGGSGQLFDERPRVPVMQNRLCVARDDVGRAPVGRLAMAGCTQCGFVWNSAFDAALLQYDQNYDNAVVSAVYDRHLRQQAHRVLDLVQDGAHIVEVGAGQGTFARAMLDQDATVTVEGYDPAWRGGDGSVAPRLDMYAGILDTPRRPADLVVSRHTIEHVPDVVGFVDALAAVAPIVCLETPDVGWSLRNGQALDFTYEHCSLFTPRAMTALFARCGFGSSSHEHVYGGQYLWSVATRSGPSTGGDDAPADFADWPQRKEDFIARWRAICEGAHGSAYVWGASGKGVTFASLVDPGGSLLTAAVDSNEAKHGKFFPMTGVPVVGPDALPDGATVIIMNPIYRDEIERRIAASGRRINIHCVA